MATITEQYASPTREVSPLRHVRGITSRSHGHDQTSLATYETYRALPSPAQPYSSYDYAVVAEIIRTAEAAVGKAYSKGQGSGVVTLQAILQAYQAVLPRHGVKPDEDTYYYRLLLKLSLDPNLDWWVKLGKESGGATFGRAAPSAGGVSTGPWPPTGPYRSPTRPSRPSVGGNSSISAVSLAPAVNGGMPAGQRRQSPYRPQQDAAMQAAAQASAQAAAAAAVARDAVNAARAAAQGGASLPPSRFVFNTPPGSITAGDWPSSPTRTVGGASAYGAGGPESVYGASSAGGALGSVMMYSSHAPSEAGAAASQYGPASSRYGPSSHYGAASARTTGDIGGPGTPWGQPAPFGGAADSHSPPGSPYGGSSHGGSPYGGTSPRASNGGGSYGAASTGGGGAGAGGWGVGAGVQAGTPYGGSLQPGSGYGAGMQAGAGYVDEGFGRPLTEAEEARLDYNRMARAFRTWRKNVFVMRITRYERDQALQNWAVATSFWAVQLLRRCFRRWAGHGPLKAAKALSLWSGNSLAGCFRGWLALVRYLKGRGLQSDGHRRTRVLRTAFRHWRQFTSRQQHKAANTLTALSFWAGRSLRVCFLLWRTYVHEAQFKWSVAGQHLMRRMLLKWRLGARLCRQWRQAHNTIRAAEERRLVSMGTRALLQAHVWRKDTARKLHGAVGRMRNVLLSRAFNKWFEQQLRMRHKRAKLGVALAWWSNRARNRAWNAWRAAVAQARLHLEAARAQARRVLRPLVQDAFYGWLSWYEAKSDRRARWQAARHVLQQRKEHMVVLAWRGQVLDRKHLALAFNLIMRHEVHRLMSTSFRRLYREHDNVRRVDAARERIQQSCSLRCLRHWKALSRAKRQHREWREQRLALASVRRRLRLLTAWRLVAGVRAEQKRLVHYSLRNVQRRLAHNVVWEWRERVLHTVQKRMKLLAALLFWEQGMKLRAWRGWRQRLAGWRAKHGKGELAVRHHRSRLQALCMGVLMAGWRAYQVTLTRALMYRSLRNDATKQRVLAEWRLLVGWLQYKNDKIRRALVYARTRLCGSALYGWYAVTRHRLAVKAAVAAAVLHWVRRRRAAAFVWWRNWAAYRRDLDARAAGYGLVRVARAKEKALVAFKANVVRKGRIARAVAHRERYLARLALSGWLLRTLLAADFVARLRLVAKQFDASLLGDSLAAWHGHVHYCRYKRGLLHAALQYWRLSRQRTVLDGLRWYAVRSRLERAVMLRGRVGSIGRVLRAWRGEAEYRRHLRDRYSTVLAGTQRKTLRRGLDLWRDYLQQRHAKRQLQDVARRYWHQGAASKAFRSWRDYNRHLRHAEERARDIVQRWRSRDAAEALAAFADYAALRRKKRAAEVLFRQRRGRQAMQAWRDYVKMKTAIDYWTGNRLTEAMAAWRRHALRQRSLRTTAGRVAARWRNLLAASAIGRWKDYTSERRRLKEIAHMLSLKTRRGQLGSVLGLWRDYSHYRSRLKGAARQLALRTRGGTLHSVMQAWREYQHYSRRLKRVAAALAARTRGGKLRSILQSWREYKAYSRQMRELAAIVSGRTRAGTLRGAMSTWRDYSSRRAMLARMGAVLSGKVRRSSLVRLFRTWRDYAGYRLHLQSAAARIGLKMMRGTLGGSFEAWRLYTARMARLKGLLVRVFMRTTALAFYGWREVVAEAQERRQQQYAIQARMADRPELGEVAAYGMARLRNFPLALAFYTWFDNASESAHLRSRASQAIFAYAGGLLRKAWTTWLAYAIRRKELGRAAAMIETRLYGRTKRDAFREWRQSARRLLRLKGILARVISRQLSMAWESWRQLVHDKHQRLEVLSRMVARWQNRLLLSAFNSWRELVARNARARRLAVRCLGRLLDASWLAWREAVYQGALERGAGLCGVLVLRRALRGWRAQAEQSRRVAAMAAQLNQRLALQALGEWRRQWLARAAMRRLYCRRALLGWHARTQQLRYARARLWGAARLLLFGSLARCFAAWLQLTQAMNLKRAVFARKQRALAEALRLGNALVRRREAELLQLAFSSWRFQAGIFKQVARRLNALRERTLALCFGLWRDYAEAKKAREMKKAHLLRIRLKERPFRTWRRVAAQLAAESEDKAAAADQQHAAFLLRKALAAFRRYHEVVGTRSGVLRRALAVVVQAQARELRARVWDAWCEFMSRRADIVDMVNRMSSKRRLRILGDVFDVWQKYTQAMREGGIDPGSPFLSPRDRRQDRQLITRMAALAGNEQAVAALDTSDDPLAGLYPSEGLQQALDRRQQLTDYLTLARRAAALSSGGARPASTGRAGRAPAGGLPPARVGSGRAPPLRADSFGGSSRASDSTGWSSGAGGADLVEQAVYLVRATPGLISPGKGRGPASGLTPVHLHYAQRTQQPAVPTASRGGLATQASGTGMRAQGGVGSTMPREVLARRGGPAGEEDPMLGSPYDDRLDYGALYDTQQRPGSAAGTAAPAFSGFTLTRQPSGAPSPVPMPRVATPLTASAPIAPRRIDFTTTGTLPSRGSAGTFTTFATGRTAAAAAAVQQQPEYGYGYGGEDDDASDTASTTSSDLMGPAAARARVSAARSAAEAQVGPGQLRGSTSSIGSASGGLRGPVGGIRGAGGVGGQGAAAGLRGSSTQFLGGSLVRQGGSVVGAAGRARTAGSILDAGRLGEAR